MRYDLGEFEWSVIQPHLPNKPRGMKRVDDWRVLNGIFLGRDAGNYISITSFPSLLRLQVCRRVRGTGIP